MYNRVTMKPVTGLLRFERLNKKIQNMIPYFSDGTYFSDGFLWRWWVQNTPGVRRQSLTAVYVETVNVFCN